MARPSASICLGCGCTCDDIELVFVNHQIVEARNACALGQGWFGNGAAPQRVCTGGRETTLNETLEGAAALLRSKRRVLVYLAADVSCEAYQQAIALADLLRARVASLSSQALPFIIAAQERGYAGATLGEIRHRARTVVFWGVDPGHRYPRFQTRYAIDPAGLDTPEGRRSRTVIAVQVGKAEPVPDADIQLTVSEAAEIDLLVAVRSLLTAPLPIAGTGGAIWREAEQLAGMLRDTSYVTFVVDGEAAEQESLSHRMLRADALIALTQELNSTRRTTMTVLRGGGNRAGAEAVLTAQTGYPAAVDFTPGWPVYSPHETNLELLECIDAVVIIGAPASIGHETLSALVQLPTIAIGPHASEALPGDVHTLIDCGVPGIHTGGLVVRMDEVPLMTRGGLAGPPDAAAIVNQLRRLCHG